MPDPRAADRLDGALPAWRMHAKSQYFCGMVHMALFERLHCLRGIENAFADFHLHPNEVNRLLDALTDYYLELIRSWGTLGGVDALFMSDDWGTQTSLMIAPAMWRKLFAARYRRLCDKAHRYGMHVIFHSCGNVTAIIGDLIDAGVDVLDPVQPEAMDLAQVARDFGGKLAFCGGISDQKLATLSPQQVTDHVHWVIDTLGTPLWQCLSSRSGQRVVPGSPPGKPAGAVRGLPQRNLKRDGLDESDSAPTLFVCWVGCHCWLVQQCSKHGWASQPWHPTIGLCRTAIARARNAMSLTPRQRSAVRTRITRSRTACRC